MYEIYLCGVYLFSYFPASSFVGASGLFCALCDMFSLKMSSGWGANTTRNATDVITQSVAFLVVTLKGIEPISKEPESSILSIKLQGQ